MENYKPSAEEINKAEEMMTDEQKGMSRDREYENKFAAGKEAVDAWVAQEERYQGAKKAGEPDAKKYLEHNNELLDTINQNLILAADSIEKVVENLTAVTEKLPIKFYKDLLLFSQGDPETTEKIIGSTKKASAMPPVVKRIAELRGLQLELANSASERTAKGIKKTETGVDSLEETIKQASTFNDLIHIIGFKKITIHGSKEAFNPEMLKNVVLKIQSREWPLDKATSAAGFRNKLAELLQRDSNVDFLKKTLGDVTYKLTTESQVYGASTDNPLNKRRDERLKWKERLKDDIKKIEDKNLKK